MKKEKILEFIHHVETLKNELRHSWTSKDKQESVAEHCWRMSIMALAIAPELDEKIDLCKVLKMAAIHDLGEIAAGDVPAFDTKGKEEQQKIEKESMNELGKDFPDILSLWQEAEECKTQEAKFVRALDKLEVRIQHNESKMGRWNDIEFPRSQYVPDKWCEYDRFLKEFNELVKKESEKKIKEESDRDFQEVLSEAEKLKKK